MILRVFSSLRFALIFFWSSFPALHAASAFLVGFGSALRPFCLIGAPLVLVKKRRISALLMLGAWMYGFFCFKEPFSSLEIQTAGVFQIKEIKRHATPYRALLDYEGTFLFENQSLPCHLYMPPKKNRPLAQADYQLAPITLIKTGPHRYLLKTHATTTWTQVKPTSSVVEKRFQAKERARKWVKTHFQNKQVQSLFISLLTGHKESRLQTFQFQKLGLQHLLAISGFHFALLSFFLAFLLRPFLPKKWIATALICLLSFYFLYMGKTPSISRAWIGVVLFLFGMVIEKKSSPFNALGLGLFSCLLLDPFVLLNCGFQLSFAATFGILFFFKPIENWAAKLLPKRRFSVIKTLPLIDQIGLLITSYLKKVFALNGAVLLFTLPLLLITFHTFSLASLVYNLFFPLLFSLLIAMFLFALCFSFFIPLVEKFAAFLLLLTTFPPKRLLFEFSISTVPFEIVLFSLISLFLLGTYIHWSSAVIKEWRLT